MAFIFDFDGTLVDSMGIWATAGSSFLKKRGITPERDLDERFKTFTLEEVADHYIKVYHLTESVKEILDSINDFIKEQYRTNITTKKGVLDFLDKNSHKEMCIATATDRHLVELFLKKHGMTEYFSAIFTCSEVGVGKTKPDIYEVALTHLGTKKEDTLVFEDALHGIKSAKLAGFPVIAVADPWAQSDKEEILQLADLYIEDFSSKLLEEWEKIK